MAKFISKVLLFICNVVYFMAALAILVMGSMSLAGSTAIIDMLDLIQDTSTIVHILDWQTLTLPAAIYLTTLGSLAMLLSLLGCFGALKDNKIILIFFAVSKLCIILFNLALIMYNAIVPFHGQDQVTDLMQENLVANYQPLAINDDTGVITMPTQNSSAWYWANMEFEQACCAAENYTDYAGVANGALSPSCCMQINQYLVPDNMADFVNYTGCITSAPSYTNYRGCSYYVMTQLLGYRQVYILTAASFIALEVIIIVLTVRVSDRRSSVGAV